MLVIKKSIDNCAVVTIANSVQAYLLIVSHKNLNAGQKRPIRVLVSKLGLDGHDRGALVICKELRDAGMEVIYSGLFCTHEQVAKMAIDEDFDVVAMSLLNGAHLRLSQR